MLWNNYTSYLLFFLDEWKIILWIIFLINSSHFFLQYEIKKKSPDNPFNQSNVLPYNASRNEEKALLNISKKNVEDRLRVWIILWIFVIRTILREILYLRILITFLTSLYSRISLQYCWKPNNNLFIKIFFLVITWLYIIR